jgi:5-(carboxyamino)imidazole ribonucleotide synthase
MIEPGATIGIVGGGQLGRMLSIAAAQLGYKCHVFDPHEHPCAADVAARVTRAAYDDVETLRRFGGEVDVATYEFENLPVEPLKTMGDKLQPGTRSLAIAQDRAVEKQFIEQCGARTTSGERLTSWDFRLSSKLGVMATTAKDKPGSARQAMQPRPGTGLGVNRR